MSASQQQQAFVGQCKKMLARTDKGSFIWIYGPAGTRVVPASEAVEQRGVPPDYLAGRNVAEQFRDVLDCFSGDLGLVGPGIFESNVALGAFLEEIAVKRGVAIKLSSGGSDD